MKKTKKSELPKKLEKAWVAYLIDATAGAKLMMLGMRYPDRANKLNQIIITAINKLYTEQLDSWRNDPEGFVYAAQKLCVELTAHFIAANLKSTLLEGMPSARILTQPTAFNPKIVH